MMKHTPGPWKIGEDDSNGQAVVRGEHIEIATCWHHCVGSIEKEMRANALLIATSPEMLAALDRYADTLCEGWCEKSSDCAHFDDCGGCEARRIAGKARGEKAGSRDHAPHPSASSMQTAVEAGNRELPVQIRLASDDSAKAARRQPGKGERRCGTCNGTGTEPNDCEFARWAQGCDICEGMGVLPLVRPTPITRPIEDDIPGFSGFLDGLADHIAAQGIKAATAGKAQRGSIEGESPVAESDSPERSTP